jgi:hypothetical protein
MALQQLDQKTPTVLVIGSAPLIKFMSHGLISYTTQGCPYSPGQPHLEIATMVREAAPSLILLELAPNDDDLFQRLREEVPHTPILVVTERPNAFQNIDATLISWPCDITIVSDQVNALIGHLNPRLSQPRRGFMYRQDNPPPDLPKVSVKE